MRLSKQRLGDNPQHYDGTFCDLDEEQKGVVRMRPDKTLTKDTSEKRTFNKWRIYPSPPPPHWHWKGKQPTPPLSSAVDNSDEAFDFSKSLSDIPQEDSHDFKLDDQGVYQVYDGGNGECTINLKLFYCLGLQ